MYCLFYVSFVQRKVQIIKKLSSKVLFFLNYSFLYQFIDDKKTRLIFRTQTAHFAKGEKGIHTSRWCKISSNISFLTGFIHMFHKRWSDFTTSTNITYESVCYVSIPFNEATIKQPLTPPHHIGINRALVMLIYMSNWIPNGGYFQWRSQGTF